MKKDVDLTKSFDSIYKRFTPGELRSLNLEDRIEFTASLLVYGYLGLRQQLDNIQMIESVRQDYEITMKDR